MKQFVLLFTIMLGITVSSNGQTYLEHLQKKTPGLGTVTVTQSKAIDELINGKRYHKTTKLSQLQPQQNTILLTTRRKLLRIRRKHSQTL